MENTSTYNVVKSYEDSPSKTRIEDKKVSLYSLLNDGGRLVAIMAGNKQKSDAKTTSFMELVDCKGYYQQNPTGSFLSSFKPTGVNTITVVLDKK